MTLQAPGDRVSASRLWIGLVAAVWLAVAGSVFAQSGTTGADRAATQQREDWLRMVPGDARFYAELTDISGVRDVFRRLGIWKLVLELSERDRPGATTRPWARRTQESLGLNADDFVNHFFSRRAALIASSSGDWQQGVLLGQLSDNEDVPTLLREWSAQRMFEEGDVRCYRLRGSLRLALLGRTIALGPSEDADGLWGRTVLLMAGRRGPHLAARSEFASLRARLSRSFAGIVYGQWTDAEPSVAGCSRLLVGFDVTADGIVSEWHGQLHRPTSRTKPISMPGISLPPQQSLVTWSFRHDPEPGPADSLGASSLFSRVASLVVAIVMEPDEGEAKFLDMVGPNYAISVGREPSTGGLPDLPVVSAMVESRAPADHVRQIDRVVSLFVMMFASFADSKDPMVEGEVRRSNFEGVEIHHVGIGPILARRFEFEAYRQVQLAWAAVGDRLVMSTSLEGARGLIRAARQPGRTTSSPADLSASERFELSGAATSGLIDAWLTYLRRQRPEMIQASWWRTWAGGQFEKVNQLGVALANDPSAPGRAVVREIQLTSPARNLLEYEDVIVAVNGESLPATDAAQDVARRYRQRGSAVEFKVDVMRRGESLKLTIPVAPADGPDLGDFDPILALERLSLLLSRVNRVRFEREASRSDRLDARLTVEWSQSQPQQPR